MVYFEFIDPDKNSYKFWEIENYWNEDRPNVYVRYGKIGNTGTEKRFYYHNNDWGSKYMQKQIDSKVKKGYVQKKKIASKSNSVKTKSTPFIDYPKRKSVKNNSNCVRRFEKKYVERSSPPIPANDCSLGTVASGNDGMSYEVVSFNSKSGMSHRWVKCNGTTTKCKQTIKKLVPSKEKSAKSVKKPKLVVKAEKKTCPPGKVLSPKGRCVIDRSKTTKAIKKPKLVVKAEKKTCPPGKVLSPKGRCVIDRTKPTKAENKPKSVKLVKKPKLVVKAKTPTIKLPKGKVLYDVKKQGVMLAHTFKDPKTGKVKTAPKGSTQAPNGWFLSEKYDGYRAIWNGQDFVSRNGNIFPSPPDFKKWMPTNEALDGELFMGRENFEKCGLFRKKEADCEAWKKASVTYQIFDSPTMSGMFEERTAKIQKLIKEQCKKHPGKCPLIMTKQVKVKTEADVYKHFDKLVSKGAEGVMLRAPNSPYDKKRSNYLLKVKQLFDAECKIIGYKAGSGKYANMLGAFECQLVKNKNIKFTISGMDDSIRQNYKKTHPIGTVVTFTYMGLTDKGVPRHPNYLRKRGKE